MPIGSMEDTPAGKAARALREANARKAEAARQALRDEGAAVERRRIVELLEARLVSVDAELDAALRSVADYKKEGSLALKLRLLKEIVAELKREC